MPCFAISQLPHRQRPLLEHISPLTSQIRFEHISINHGLSNSFAQCILQDRTGYMWFGTQEGLNRYDGYSFKIFRYFDDDTFSISNNNIRALYEDRNGFIWIGTDNGLNRFDPAKEYCTRFQHNPRNANSIISNTILSIAEDSDGRLWVGTDVGLDRYDSTSNTFTHYVHNPKDTASLSHNYVGVLHTDKQGILWIGTGYFNLGGGGLNRYEKRSDAFMHYRNDKSNPHSLINDWVTAICEDNAGTLWVGTDGGLEELNKKTNAFTHYVFEIGASWNSLGVNNIKAVRADRSGALWIGTWQDGLFRFNKSTSRFVRYVNNSSDPKSISNNFPICIYEDKSGLFWIGTIGAGINKFQPVRKTFTHFKFNDPDHVGPAINDIRSFHGDGSDHIWVGTMWGLYHLNLQTGYVLPAFVGDQYINAMCEDNRGILWLGTGNGMFSFDIKKKRILRYYQVDYSTPDPSGGSINSLIVTNRGMLWVGAMSFLAEMNPNVVKLRYYTHDIRNSESMSSNNVRSVLTTRTGDLWIGTNYGLNKMKKTGGSFERYFHDPNNPHSLSNNDVRVIFEDRIGILWIGTSNGLNMYKETDHSFIDVSKHSGILNTTINGILEDSHGNLWLSTNRGLSRFDRRTNTFKNYDVSDGLQGNEFNTGASFKDPYGNMFFGGINGITVFHPDSIYDSDAVPAVVITNFRLFNDEVPIGKQMPLQTSITNTKVIHLSHDQNSFSFEFASLDYESPAKNKFAYMLEGVDKDWKYAGSQRIINFANLSPGDYVFRVTGSNKDGVWNTEGASIAVIITPPWWKRWWAYSLYVLSFFGAAMGVYRVRIHRFTLEQKILFEHLQAEKLSEMNALKSRFLANVSHELRTPLSLILGPTEYLLTQKNDNERNEQLALIQRNAHRLLRLIELLLQFSRLESGRVNLLVTREEIVSVIRRITGYFSSPAAKKHIELRFSAAQESIVGFIDAEKIEHILQNCLSNAVKFTPPGGQIDVRVHEEKNEMIFSVHDSGVGIASEHLPHVFERFYRVETTHKTEGTGIGLSLSKELVEIHHGSMHLESEVGKGTSVTVRIPLSGYTDAEFDTRKKEGSVQQEKKQVASHIEATEFDVERDDQPIILIAEDNDDARAFIKSQFVELYTVLEATDGIDALQKTKSHIPDLVISDVMMPKKDGRELCSELKQDERTSHIPVILLTALAEKEDKIEGLSIGADEYMIKPFDAAELQARVRNLLETRKRLRETFGRTVPLTPGEISVTSIEDAFLKKTIDIVRKHLSDPDFGVEAFAHEIFLSRTQLHRKLKAITNLSATDFIRHLRLQRAKELLEKNAGSVSEIADSVGFTNHSYFAKCFQEQFGLLPNEIRRQQN